jgi:hypothetical protein
MNALYKDLANSIYGNVVRGMSNKLTFDTKTGQMFRMTGTQLSNPILASRTTAFIRSVMGECLHNIWKMGGKVVSATTDGFITDIEGLEQKLLNLPQKEAPLFQNYKLLIEMLDKDGATALEVKHEGKGIVSWATRGQLGLDSKIKATVGFQGRGYSHDEIVSFYTKALSSEEKEFEYTQSSLRSAKDIFKQGGHVTEKLKDQIVRVLYDNRREIIESENFEGFDLSNILLDSKPVKDKDVSLHFRFVSKFCQKKSYLKSVNLTKSFKTRYKSYLEIAIRNFIKGYLAKEPYFGLRGSEFLTYGEIIHFIYGFDQAKSIKLTRSSISHLKQRKLILRPVPKTLENLKFTEYLMSNLPHFNKVSFLKIS